MFSVFCLFAFLNKEKRKKRKKGEEPSSFGLRLQDSYSTSALSTCTGPFFPTSLPAPCLVGISLA